MANQITKDLIYSQGTVSQKGSTAQQATEGGQSKSAAELYATRIEIDVKCTPKQRDCICNALPHEIVVYQPPRKAGFEAHPQLSFLADYVQSTFRTMNFAGKAIKVVGAKFTKKEASAYGTADSVHYCLLRPSAGDEFRANSSLRFLELQLKEQEVEILLIGGLVKGARESITKCNPMHAAANLDDMTTKIAAIKNYSTRVEEMGFEKARTQRLIEALKDTKGCFQSDLVCTGGVEQCDHKCDYMICNDSIYDIDLNALVRRANEVGTKEIYAVAIVPFGLKYVESYYSEELDVHFKRVVPAARPLHSKLIEAVACGLDPTGIASIASWAQTLGYCAKVDHTKDEALGFEMWHGSDMSNGYIHSNGSFMKLMYTNFVRDSHDVVWMYEIVQNVAEICAFRFVRLDSSIPRHVVRKEMPAKFNDFYVCYNPLKYFANYPEYELMMLPKKKMDLAIHMVSRAEKTTKIVQSLFSHVQASFLRVEVAGTTLQPGADAAPYDVKAIVLAALIIGTFDRNDVATKWANGRDSVLDFSLASIPVRIVSSIIRSVKALAAHNFPNIVHYFTDSKAEKYFKSFVDLSTTKMESTCDKRTFSFWWDVLKEEARKFRSWATFDKYTLFEIITKPDFVFSKMMAGRGKDGLKKYRDASVRIEERKEKDRLAKEIKEKMAIDETVAELEDQVKKIQQQARDLRLSRVDSEEERWRSIHDSIPTRDWGEDVACYSQRVDDFIKSHGYKPREFFSGPAKKIEFSPDGTETVIQRVSEALEDDSGDSELEDASAVGTPGPIPDVVKLSKSKKRRINNAQKRAMIEETKKMREEERRIAVLPDGAAKEVGEQKLKEFWVALNDYKRDRSEKQLYPRGYIQDEKPAAKPVSKVVGLISEAMATDLRHKPNPRASGDVDVGSRALRGVALQRSRRDVGNEGGHSAPVPGVAMSAKEAKEFERKVRDIPFSTSDHAVGSRTSSGYPMPDERSRAALQFNALRKTSTGGIKLLDPPRVKQLMKQFTIEGRVANCVVSADEAQKMVEDLHANYFSASSYPNAGPLLECKKNMQALAGRIRKGGYAEAISRKKIRVINGYAGSGKTSYILSDFDKDQDVYVVPFSAVMADTRKAIKSKFEKELGVEVDPQTKTFEQVASSNGELRIKNTGRKFVVDECSGVPIELLVTYMLATDYEEYTFIGDTEQTEYFDTLAALRGSQYTSLVPSDAITSFCYTFRYGPTLAAFMNHTLNYPVVSLRNEDTKVVFNNLSAFNSETPGKNICISSSTRDHYEAMTSNFTTAGAAQGRTVDRTNLILAGSDAHDFLAFRNSGVVASSRCQYELQIYAAMDDVSKSQKSVSHILDFAINYSAVFDVVIPTAVDF